MCYNRTGPVALMDDLCVFFCQASSGHAHGNVHRLQGPTACFSMSHTHCFWPIKSVVRDSCNVTVDGLLCRGTSCSLMFFMWDTYCFSLVTGRTGMAYSVAARVIIVNYKI